VSLLLGQTPVIFQGLRHYISFVWALLAIQCFPQDAVYASLRENKSIKATVGIGCALYKLRKTNYIMERASSQPMVYCNQNSLADLATVALLVFLAVEGSNVVRSMTSVFTMPSWRIEWRRQHVAWEAAHVFKRTIKMAYPSIICGWMLHWCRQCLPADHHNAQCLVLAYLIYRHNKGLIQDTGWALGYGATDFIQRCKQVWSVVAALLFFKLFLVAYLGWGLDFRRQPTLV